MKHKIIFIVLLTILFVIFGYLGLNRNRSSQPPSKKATQANPYELAKYSITQFLKEEPESTRSAQQLPPLRSYAFWKAKLIYFPLSDDFQGHVESAQTIAEYRQAKELLIRSLIKKGIKVCDLGIHWIRPFNLKVEDFTVEDGLTDGCE